MATTTFSTLPTEIQLSIAEYCGNNDLINLCLTSELIKEVSLRVLYRHVDLLGFDRHDPNIEMFQEFLQVSESHNRQQQFVDTLLSHPEYGKYVRYFKGRLCIPRLPRWANFITLAEDENSEKELWRAMRSLTHVRSVDVGTRNSFIYRSNARTKQFPKDLFRSAKSVRLVGHMQYGLARSILKTVNPATLRHLCLDVVQDHKIGNRRNEYVAGERGRNGNFIAFGATSGLVKKFTGRCTALRTLILRSEGQIEGQQSWHAAAEEVSYIEWASFVRSVRGTLENFTFEHGGKSIRGSRTMDEAHQDDRFQRLIFPAIVSGNWPCLKSIKLRGVRRLNGQFGEAALTMELRDVLGANAKILVEDQADHPQDDWDPSYG